MVSCNFFVLTYFMLMVLMKIIVVTVTGDILPQVFVDLYSWLLWLFVNIDKFSYHF